MYVHRGYPFVDGLAPGHRWCKICSLARTSDIEGEICESQKSDLSKREERSVVANPKADQ